MPPFWNENESPPAELGLWRGATRESVSWLPPGLLPMRVRGRGVANNVLLATEEDENLMAPHPVPRGDGRGVSVPVTSLPEGWGLLYMRMLDGDRWLCTPQVFQERYEYVAGVEYGSDLHMTMMTVLLALLIDHDFSTALLNDATSSRSWMQSMVYFNVLDVVTYTGAAVPEEGNWLKLMRLD